MVPQRSHHEIEEILGAYALDAVDADERDIVDAHLPTCPRCRAEIEQHREVAALLAHTGESAPEGVWDRIVASLEGATPGVDPEPPPLVVPMAGRRRRPASASWPARLALGAVSVAASIVIALLIVQVEHLDEQVDGLRGDLALASVEQRYERAAADDDSVVVDLVSVDGAVDARAVLSGDGTGYLRGVTLPELTEGRTYQLWGVTPDSRVVSLGVFGADPDYETFPVSGDFVQFALTEEVDGGVAVSDQDPVAAGEVRDA